MFTILLSVLAVVVIAFLIAVALRPSEFCIVRTASIAAAPAIVFEQINNFHNWEAWSPWARLDPAARNSFRKVYRKGSRLRMVRQKQGG